MVVLKRFASAGSVLLCEDARAERDVLFDGLLVQDLERVVDRLRAAGGVLEGGGEDSVLHIADTFGRQRIDADELDCLLPALSLLPRRLEGSKCARIVVSID